VSKHDRELEGIAGDTALAKLHELQRAAAKRERELKAVIRQLEAERDGLAEVVGSFAGLDEPNRIVAPIKPLARAQGPLPEATYIALASDWHMGERVRGIEVGGCNEYSPEIARARAEQFFRSNLVMLRTARSAWNVNQLVLWLGGDFMTNWIHEEYHSENYLSPLEEVELVHDTLAAGLQFILDQYECERVVVVTSNGNHGRDTLKKHAAGAFRKSYEFHLYQRLAKEFAGRVEFQLGYGYENVFSVYGFRIRFHHGDAIRSLGGVGGVDIPLKRRFHRINASAPEPAHMEALGHFHTYGFPKHFAMNGSLIGFNAFAAMLGCEFEEPMQASFVIDAKHRVVSNMNPIFVKEPRRVAKK
jgi:hypothetical protein